MNFIKNIFKKWTEKMESERLSSNTLSFASLGLINNRDVCIKGMTTCVCVCANCSSLQFERLQEFAKSMNQKSL